MQTKIFYSASMFTDNFPRCLRCKIFPWSRPAHSATYMPARVDKGVSRVLDMNKSVRCNSSSTEIVTLMSFLPLKSMLSCCIAHILWEKGLNVAPKNCRNLLQAILGASAINDLMNTIFCYWGSQCFSERFQGMAVEVQF